ncbi:MAG TPA: hypothetical protein PLL77_05320 [Pyrinomonadaceae bacterium]|nr:hypothetical protein [Pyrinomonadaceae bacterium]
MQKVVRWETPFTDSRWPSAVIVVQPSTDGPYPISAVVAPKGIDGYPKYLVHFGEVVAFTCMEEMHFPERDTLDAICEIEGLAAYEFLESTWLKSYEKGEYFLFNTDGSDSERLRHYLIVGGDNNIEVITKNIPIFETIEDSKIMEFEFVI